MSQFSPPALLLLLVAVGVILFGPRRYVLPALLFFGVFIPMANRLSIMTLDFMPHRILVIVGILRVCMRREGNAFSLNSMDKVMIALTLWGVFAYSVLWGTMSAVVYQGARALDMLGLYFLFRAYLRSEEDLFGAIKTTGVLCAVLAAFMCVEAATGRNALSALGLDEQVWSRRGRLRCRGSFGHAISAGVYGASLMPLWLAGWRCGGWLRKWSAVGLVTSTLMTVTSASSSSLLTYVAGVGAFFFWTWRSHLRTVRWAVLLLLICLHIVMKAPVWALLQRVNLVGGSTGNYRYRLFDAFVRTVDQWWLFGIKEPEEVWGMWDLCNQYVLEGARGGLLRVGLFVAMLVLCFREVGRVLAIVENDDRRAILVWSMGAMLFAHFMAFWGADYWDQIRVPWYLMLAIIPSLREIMESPGLPKMTTESQASEFSGEPSPAPGS
jgi:hypothetical protein